MPDDMLESINNVAQEYKCKKSEVVRRAVNKLIFDIGIERGEIETEIDIDGEKKYYYANQL
jgi:metal-responsive CopG/Arc/MetJ family transcriptional regulator